MKLLKSSCAAACVFLAASGAAFAGGISYEMPSIYYDGLSAKLINSGYRGVRVIDAERQHIVAFDQNGSEVLMVAHPTNYKIVSSTYVHLHDN